MVREARLELRGAGQLVAEVEFERLPPGLTGVLDGLGVERIAAGHLRLEQDGRAGLRRPDPDADRLFLLGEGHRVDKALDRAYHGAGPAHGSRHLDDLHDVVGRVGRVDHDLRGGAPEVVGGLIHSLVLKRAGQIELGEATAGVHLFDVVEVEGRLIASVASGLEVKHEDQLVERHGQRIGEVPMHLFPATLCGVPLVDLIGQLWRPFKLELDADALTRGPHFHADGTGFGEIERSIQRKQGSGPDCPPIADDAAYGGAAVPSTRSRVGDDLGHAAIKISEIGGGGAGLEVNRQAHLSGGDRKTEHKKSPCKKGIIALVMHVSNVNQLSAPLPRPPRGRARCPGCQTRRG